MKFAPYLLAISATVAMSVATTAAHAVVVNISATNSASPSTSLSLGSGTYYVSWLAASTTTGATFSGWQAAGPTSGYRNTFTVEGATFSVPAATGAVTVDLKATSHYVTHPTLADSLAAFNASAAAYDLLTGAGSSAAVVGTVSGPLQFTLASATTLKFYVPDQVSSFGDNIGGVSLNITAVPEPETYALVLAGLATAGVLARRRRSV